MREYIKKEITIDGRNLPYKIYNAEEYFRAKGYSEKEITEFEDSNIKDMITQVIAIKHACYLLRNTSHSCDSLQNSLWKIKNNLILRLKCADINLDESIIEI